MGSKHGATNQRTDDGARPADAEAPAGAGGADKGGIEGARENDEAGLPAHYTRAGEEGRAVHQKHIGAGNAHDDNADCSGEQHRNQRAVKAHPVKQWAEQQGRDNAAGLLHSASIDRLFAGQSGAIEDRWRPACEQEDVKQHQEEHAPQKQSARGPLLREEMGQCEAARIRLADHESRIRTELRISLNA